MSIYRGTFRFPTDVAFGAGVIDGLAEHLTSKGFTKPLIITDPGLAKLKLIIDIVAKLKKDRLQVELFSQLDRNPTANNVMSGVEYYKKHSCDCIVGIGGGASLDVARSVVMKVNHEGELFDYEDGIGDHLIVNDIPYFVAVPTTSGTGSEVGRSAVISDDKTHQKKIIFSPRLMPKQVFADPMLTIDLPAKVTATTGIDALTHNIEAYLAKGFHPMCDGIALEGIKLVHQSIEKATLKPDVESRSLMMAASMMGSVAFQKGLGVVHSMAHALSAHKDLHHGEACAITLPYCLAFNAKVVEERIVEIAKIFGINNPSSQKLVQYLIDLNKKLGILTKLSECGISEADIDKLAELSLEDGCHTCNAREVTLDDFKKLYKDAL